MRVDFERVANVETAVPRRPAVRSGLLTRIATESVSSCGLAARLHNDDRPSMKVSFTANMKCAAASILLSFALLSQAFAVLRPLFPSKPAPPFSGEPIVIGDDLPRRSGK
jgi:hypothetical protein